MRLISLASGTLPEFDPVTVVESAAAAGFSGCGVWYDPDAWTDNTTRSVRAAFASTGITPLEMEVLVVGDADRSAGALSVLTGVGHANLKLLVDPLHMARTELTPAELASVPSDCFSFAQFCDAWQSAPHDGSFEALYDEALHGRLLPGDGDLPLTAIVDALPDGIPLSVELRARWLRDQFPDPAARARVVFEATAGWLLGQDSPG